MANNDQPTLIDLPLAWEDQWKGMPEFNQEDKMPWRSVKVHFKSQEDRQAFAKLIGQKLTNLTPSIWFPKAEAGTTAPSDTEQQIIIPKYPVYIISKGRWDSRLTSKALDRINVPYHIVVEPQELSDYAAVIPIEKILTLPFSNLGQGSIPARNWVWEHSLSIGAERHWILDDNIGSFMRLHDNKKTKVTDGSIFAYCEEFTDRYENIALSGMNYQWFAKQKQLIPPFVLNTRIYSCILVKNNIPYRWRGRYNEDTDLSLRALKDRWCTVLFNAFLADKMTTMTMKGGNTDELYQDDGRMKMAQSLKDQHPDIVQITEKWGRPQHHVNYKIFRTNRLVLKPDVVIPEGQNDYGMSLQILGQESESEIEITEPDSNGDELESNLESEAPLEDTPVDSESQSKALGPQLGLF